MPVGPNGAGRSTLLTIPDGGKKPPLNLIKFLVSPPNFLPMAEPTTHLNNGPHRVWSFDVAGLTYQTPFASRSKTSGQREAPAAD